MFIAIKRTFKEALINFKRNGWLSVAAVSILFFSLFTISVVYVVVMTTNGIIKNVQDRVNVSLYFNSAITETEIFAIEDQIQTYPEVKTVLYVPKEQALEDFKKSNANDELIMKSLEEIGGNPLLSSLMVKANNSNDYEKIYNKIIQESFYENVSRINYDKNKEIIAKLNDFVDRVRKAGIILASLFVIISILITFNTIRITIYVHKPEIEIMRLVGASNTFIKLPFIFEGIIYGLVSSLISVGALFLTLKFAGTYVAPGFSADLVKFFVSNFWQIMGLQLAVGAILGVLSSFIAIGRYLKV